MHFFRSLFRRHALVTDSTGSSTTSWISRAGAAIRGFQGLWLAIWLVPWSAFAAAAPSNITLSASSIAENNLVNASVGTLSATDADSTAFTYSLTDTANFPDNDAFAITGTNLNASVSFNFETKASYSIKIRVTDDTSNTFDKVFTIAVTDNAAEVAPTISDQTLAVAENSAAASCHGSVAATDADGDSFTFQIVSSGGPVDPQENPEGLFTINPTTGQLCVINNTSIAAKYLDAERVLEPEANPDPPYRVRVRVTDRDGRNSTATVTVTISNVYEPPRLIDPNPVTVPEHSAGDIATMEAYDVESAGATPASVTFSLTAGHTVGADPVFAIDSTSGVISVLRPDLLDYEQRTNFSITVRIQDNRQPPNADTATLAVNLTDVVPTLRTASLFLLANASQGTVLGLLDVLNPDGGDLTFRVLGFSVGGVSQAAPDTIFEVDDRKQLVLLKNAVEVLRGFNLDNNPDLRLTLEIRNTANDVATAELPLILQQFPGGSPIMLNPVQGVGHAFSGRNEGDPVQDVAVGLGSELAVVGMVNGRGYLKIYPRGLSDPRIIEMPDNFVPTAVAADKQFAYVAGHTGVRKINNQARLLENSIAKSEPSGATAAEASVRRYPLRAGDPAPVLSTNPFYWGYDSIINDITVSDGHVFVCGAGRFVQIGTFDPFPLTYTAIWAKLNTDLGWVDGRAISPNNPSAQTTGGFGWLDTNEYRAYYCMFTAIAVAPDNGDLYLAGYNLTWRTRENQSPYGNGWIVQMKHRDNGTYGDPADAGDAKNLLANETWIADQGNQGSSRVATSDGRQLLNMTFIKDLVFVKGATKSTLYAFEEYRGRGIPYPGMKLRGAAQSGPGYDNERATDALPTGELALNLKIARFSPGLASDTGTSSAYIRVKQPRATDAVDGELRAFDVRGGTMTSDPEGNIYVSGMIPAGLTVTFGAGSPQEAVHSRDRFFLAKYNPDLAFQWVQIFTDGGYTPLRRPSPQRSENVNRAMEFTTSPQFPQMSPMVVEWHPGWHALLVGGNFIGGQVELRLGNEVNWVTTPADGSKGGFLTFVGSGGSFVKSQGLVIQSIAETDGRPVGNDQLIRPYLGGSAPAIGDTITVEVPKYIYAERDGAGNEVYLGTFESPPSDDLIRTRAVTRYVNLGITVGNREFHSDSTSYSFVFTEGTTVTINWRPEHAVIIENDLATTGSTLVGGVWTRASEGLGLTSTAAGLPQPPADKHWVHENEIFTAFINGSENDPVSFGTRYATLGYAATGTARTDALSRDLVAAPQVIPFDETEARQQATPFVVKGPAKLVWKWKPQHRIQVSTSSSRSSALPRIHVTDSSGQDDSTGIDEAWYDRGTKLIIGARDDIPSSLRLLGWLSSSGQFQSPQSAPSGRDDNLLTATFDDALFRTYRGYAITGAGLTGPIQVLWNYGDPIFYENVTLGEAVQWSAASFPLALISTSPGRVRKPDSVRVVSGPAGSTGDDMQLWDAVEASAYPVRPGIYLMEWNRPNSDSKVVLQVTAGFGGDRVAPNSTTDTTVFAGAKRHYRHLAHPDLPPVALDADATDGYALLGLRYSESDGSAVQGQFRASTPGRHVLVFSRSPEPAVPALGDLTREAIRVRVVETRRWNQVYAEQGGKVVAKGAWSDVASTSMLQEVNPTTEPAVIGRKLTSALDRSNLGTGFIVTPRARYNANIYDRTKVDDAGPIIPVNRHFSTADDDDLIVIWYEPSDAAAPSVEPAGIRWPWQSARYETRWPERSEITLVRDSGNQDVPQPVDRIVIASRLGSEGHNNNGIVQTFFDRSRFDRVRIYVQNDRTRAGYNPNEEHAMVAPSFKYLDQAKPPLAAYAFQRTLNVLTQDANYTSDPYVLVEFFDLAAGRLGPDGRPLGEYRMAVYQVELEDDRLTLNPYRYPEIDPDPANPNDQREFPYTFNYGMRAGEPVQPPYPLGLLVGLTPCPQTQGTNLSPARIVYWEDHKGQPWAVSEGFLRSTFYYPQAIDFWNGEGSAAVPPGSCVLYRTEGEVFVTGRRADPVFGAGDSFTVNATTVVIGGTSNIAFRDALNALALDVEALVLPTGEIRLRSKSGSNFTLTDGTGSPLLTAGIGAPLTYTTTRGVTYEAKWPDALPVLKVGETLTYAGGEYKADHPGPEQPGLPGVIGWASGRVVFDSLNPDMNNQVAFDRYAARLVSPLEDRTVTLSDADAAAFETRVQPATGITRVVGAFWKFNGLSASVGKRILYDPLNNRFILRGYVNDRTLGDSDLTAAPPPVYVLEPNILTGRERDALLLTPRLSSDASWVAAINALYKLGRNPSNLSKSTPAADPYYVGIESDVEQTDNQDRLDAQGRPVLRPFSARHRNALGPGIALVASPALLDPADTSPVAYLTLAENDDPRVGGPVSLFIVKIEKQHRYRGAIKTILSDNVFDEKITLRHTADFGANGDDIVYQWFYREEDGQAAPLPPDPAWKLFPDSSDNAIKGLGQYQISVEGTGGLILADNLLFLRYRHKSDVPVDGNNSVNWAKPSVAKPNGTDWNRYGAEYRDPEAKDTLGNPDDGLKSGGLWAGAANSPSPDKVYRAQLVSGWIKRVLDRVNPYEARFSDFRNNPAPATYSSMILEAGRKFEGAVALNPAKNVIENVGLIELYQTVLDRGIGLSIGLSSPITTPGINNALLLAATRISDLYMLLGNEAYTDALDPTVGFGSASVEYGSAAPSVFAFQNQAGSLLDEELALLRGVDDSYGTPVYNRLFWNFTKAEGEVAYAMNYNIKDVNQDGFVDENDARVLFPQGHGDAWGHYLTALKSRYRLLRDPFFNWQTRSELYNLLDVVVPVDYLDEKKFAEAAAAKAQAGAEIVNLTYRSRYVDDPAGQWQGYTDPVPGREWGVTEWARRAGQGALFDWITANALLPARETNALKQGIRRIDRGTVPDIAKVSAGLGAVQTTFDGSNTGLNPLGLDSDVVPFDIDPLFTDIGSTAAIGRPPIQGTSHFEQIYERAFAAINNARVAFDYANVRKNALRQIADSADEFRRDVVDTDREYRNRLIEIFGTPYQGAIGTGKPYPAGYDGPDLGLFMYVDVREVTTNTVPAPSATYGARISAFANDLKKVTGRFKTVLDEGLLTSLDSNLASWTNVFLTDTNTVQLRLPATAGTYTFQAPADWGTRASPGRLQSIISDMVQTEADLAYAVGNYDVLISAIENQAGVIKARNDLANSNIEDQEKLRDVTVGLNALIQTLKAISAATSFAADLGKNIAEATADSIDVTVGLSFTPAKPLKLPIRTFGDTGQFFLRLASLITSVSAEAATADKERYALNSAIEIATSAFKYDLQEQLKALRELLINEGTTRIAVFRLQEQLRSQADQYRAALEEGSRLIQERETFNLNTASSTQLNRYQDMSFRVSRNDALQKYRTSFDLAARYVYMAAKAYDYETNLSPNDRGSVAGLYNEIVRARSLGEMADGIALQPGGGLAGIMATMMDNFRVVETQMSLNNYQLETSSFSMREELFGIDSLPSSDDAWRQTLLRYRKDNLWDTYEFRRYCRPFAARSAAKPEPGLVIPFSTEIKAGRNFFGQPLRPGHGAFDPTVFSTKIRSAALQFTGYDGVTLSKTPRVYLVPAGTDVMLLPHSRTLEPRLWNVVDQTVPPPFKTGLGDLADPDFIPAIDSLNGTLGGIRRYSSFLVTVGDLGDPPYDTRLVARSAWNTQWLLIVPGQTFLEDAQAGLSQFVQTVTDITLTLETYGSSGN